MERLNAFPVDDRRHLDHHIVGDPFQRTAVGDVHLKLSFVVVHQPVDDRHLLLPGLGGAERLNQAGFGVVGQPGHLG